FPFSSFGPRPFFSAPFFISAPRLRLASSRQPSLVSCRFLGARVIALFGGFATAFNMGISASVLWVMARPVIPQDANLVQALYDLNMSLVGPGSPSPWAF